MLTIGGTLGVTAFGAILNSVSAARLADGDDAAHAFESAFHLLFEAACAPAALSFLIAFAIRKQDVVMTETGFIFSPKAKARPQPSLAASALQIVSATKIITSDGNGPVFFLNKEAVSVTVDTQLSQTSASGQIPPNASVAPVVWHVERE